MRRTIPLFLVTLLLVLPCQAAAQEAEPAPIVTEGFAAYTRSGSDSAIAVWTRGWDESDSATVTTLRQSLATMREAFGQIKGYEVVHTFPLSSRIRRTYAVIWFEGRPLFAFFQAYQAPEGDWRILDLTWNTDWEKVFPATLVDR